MTRAEQVTICKTCLNREFNPQKGIICTLTKDIANFNTKCEHYAVDEPALKKSLDQSTMYEDEITSQNGAKDMIWGALWFTGGLVATIADFGYIFYGAIIYGAVKMFSAILKSKQEN